ncbi:MAG: hypothetical protein M1834_009253 [Cirrosporium novae-zelandiae]|nr:MAG: hypothetical protein M1834_009253 [Cirrosporium novae-zelandiae]
MDIKIPSPSAFLSSSVIVEEPTPTPLSTTAKSLPKRSRPPTKPTAKRPTDGNPASAVQKPKQSKSRNGCVTCKTKRLKCDETKPTCQQCQKRKVACGGYKKDFKWRSFEEASFTNKPTITKPKRGSLCVPTDDNGKHCQGQVSSPSPSDASHSTAGKVDVPPTQNHIVRPLDESSPINSSSTFSQIPPNHGTFIPEMSHFVDGHDQAPMFSPFFMDNTLPQGLGYINNMFDDNAGLPPTFTRSSSLSQEESPQQFDLMFSNAGLDVYPADFVELHQTQSGLSYHPSETFLPQSALIDQTDDIEEIIRQPPDPRTETWEMRFPSPASSASSPSSDGTISKIFLQPMFQIGSPEMLMSHFDRQTCGILSVKDGPSENPWRTLIWPLANDCAPLRYAMYSMAAFHASKEVPRLRVEGIKYTNSSVGSLCNDLQRMSLMDTLATTLVLAFAESWDQQTSAGTQHLRAAKELVIKILKEHRQQPYIDGKLARSRFLCNTWVYLDVIARLTSVSDDDFNDFEAALFPVTGPCTGLQEIDPLMGCASTLFPMIGRVANLVHRVRRVPCNSPAIISQASELKRAIEEWQVPPNAAFEPAEDPSCEIEHSRQTAEAYRWATLLYLHQAVPEIPSRSASELAKKVLCLLATIPLNSRTIIVQIYPLLAAGCEAVNEEDREWVHNRWQSMTSRMAIGNLDRCIEVVKEVWNRRDAFATEVEMEQQRRLNGKMPAGFAPNISPMKRKFHGSGNNGMESMFGWSDPFSGPKRRSISMGDGGSCASVPVPQSRKKSADGLESLEHEKTVRGRLHWQGVMSDWNWEGKLYLSQHIFRIY